MRFRVVGLVTPLVLAAATNPLAAQKHHTDSRADWVANCADWNNEWERVCEVRTLGFKPTGGTLTADGGMNGGAWVVGWERDSVNVEARIQVHARTLDGAKRIAQQIQILTDGGRLRAEGPSRDDDESWAVTFNLSVPKKSNLDLTAHNGPVAVEGVTGTMELRTVNGPVVLSNVAGDVRARTQNGSLDLTLGGASWSGKGLDAVTSNGPVNLYLPEGYNAHLETGTVNGPIDIRFPITVNGLSGHRIVTELGKGGPAIRAVTTNGPVHVTRPSDADKEG